MRVPQGGLRKPRKTYPATVATSTTLHIDRLPRGRWRVWWSKEDRYFKPMQIGSALVCVVDNFGDLVTVWEEANDRF